MRSLSGPLVELQRRDSQSSRGWLKEANEQEGEKKENRSRNRKDWDNRSMKIQRKYNNYQWEVSARQEWKDKQIEMKMVEENAIAIWEIIIVVRKKRRHWLEKTLFHSIGWKCTPKSIKKGGSTSGCNWASFCCDLWAHYCFTSSI